MSIARAEQLKKDLTDRFVVVADGVAELRRFSGLTGTVRTVNMNGRALVQFDNPVDISWYDIDPSYLQVIDAPLKKEKPAAHAPPAAPAKAAPAAKPAGQSPLDAIRAKAGAAPAAPAGEKKASPLDMIRAGGAKKEAAPAAAAKPAASQAAASPPAASEPEPAAQPAPAPQETAAPPASTAAKPKSTSDILASIRKKS
jgi:hypothetical protein